MARTIPIVISVIIPLFIGLIAFGVLSYKMPELPTSTDPQILAATDAIISNLNDGVSFIIFGMGIILVSMTVCINALCLKSISFV